MSDEQDLSRTVVVRRPPKDRTDARGESAQCSDVELELMSTQVMERFLQEANDDDLVAIGDVADVSVNGVIARDCATGRFEILSEVELAAILDVDEQVRAAQQQRECVDSSGESSTTQTLSLVSTQDLLKLLGADEHVDDDEESSGFDPYDRG